LFGQGHVDTHHETDGEEGHDRQRSAASSRRVLLSPRSDDRSRVQLEFGRAGVGTDFVDGRRVGGGSTQDAGVAQ
jgi:hypothetical protein